MNSLYQFADEHYNRAGLRRAGLLAGVVASFEAGYMSTRHPETSALIRGIVATAGAILPQLTLIPSDRANIGGYLQGTSEERRRTSKEDICRANKTGHFLYFTATTSSFALGTLLGVTDTIIAAKFREMGIL